MKTHSIFRAGLLVMLAALLPACAQVNVDNLNANVVSIERAKKAIKPDQSKSYDLTHEAEIATAIEQTLEDLGYEVQVKRPELGLTTAERIEDVDQGAEAAKQVFLIIMVGSTTESPDVRVYNTSVTVSRVGDKLKVVQRIQGRGEMHNGHITNAFDVQGGSYYAEFFRQLDKNLGLKKGA